MSASDAQGLAPLSSAAKLRLVGEILRTYVSVRWLMRGNDIREMVAQLRGDAEGGRQCDRPLARRLGRAVSRTLRLLPTDSRCLSRALVLDTLLARRSLQSVVVIAARAEPDFEAHAWVEHDGIAVLPAGSAGYQRLIDL